MKNNVKNEIEDILIEDVVEIETPVEVPVHKYPSGQIHGMFKPGDRVNVLDQLKGYVLIGKIINYDPTSKKYRVNGNSYNISPKQVILSNTPISKMYKEEELELINEKQNN